MSFFVGEQRFSLGETAVFVAIGLDQVGSMLNLRTCKLKAL